MLSQSSKSKKNIWKRIPFTQSFKKQPNNIHIKEYTPGYYNTKEKAKNDYLKSRVLSPGKGGSNEMLLRRDPSVEF